MNSSQPPSPALIVPFTLSSYNWPSGIMKIKTTEFNSKFKLFKRETHYRSSKKKEKIKEGNGRKGGKKERWKCEMGIF